ncbi:MAG: hypothetical protein WCG10_08170 [Chlamydiota bacterium]
MSTISTQPVTERIPQAFSIKAKQELIEDVISQIAQLHLTAPQIQALDSSSSLNVQSLEADMGISIKRLALLSNIKLPQFVEGPGYSLVLVSWILGAPALFEHLLMATPQDAGSVRVFKELFNQLVVDLVLKEGDTQCIDQFFHKLIYSKMQKIIEKTLATPFKMKTEWGYRREESLSHRVKLKEQQPRALEYLSKLLKQTGHTEISLPSVLQVIHIPRVPRAPQAYKTVWCLDRFIQGNELACGDSRYLVFVREQHWRAEEEYAILPIVQFSIEGIQYRLKSFSAITIEDKCICYLVENKSLFKLQSKTIKYFNEVDILKNIEKYLKAPFGQKPHLEGSVKEFMIELMGSLDSCIYERVLD